MAQRSLEHSSNNEQDPRIDPIVDRYVNNPKELIDLHDLRDGVGEEWEKDGFVTPEVFITPSGEPVVVAPKEGEDVQTPERAYRLIFNGKVIDLEVPRELQGSTMDTRGAGGHATIYDLHPENDPLNWSVTKAPTDIPSKLEILGEIIGDSLTIDEAAIGDGGGRTLVGQLHGETWTARGLDEVTQAVADFQQGKETDHMIARGIEMDARSAARLVKKGWGFMNAGTMEQKREEAYSNAIARHMLPDSHFAPRRPF